MTRFTHADIQAALAIAAKLNPPVDPAGEDWRIVDLSLTERRFLVGWIHTAASDALAELKPRRRKRPNLDRDFWVAMDFHTAPKVRGREKAVAQRWDLAPRQVATIASRMRKNCLPVSHMAGVRAVVEWHRTRLVSSHA